MAKAQEFLGSQSPWSDVTKLAELQRQCRSVPDDMIWCLHGVNSLLSRGLLSTRMLSLRYMQGSQRKRSILHVLVFKHKLKNYLLDTFAAQILKLERCHVTTLQEHLNGFASLDQITDSLKTRLESMCSLSGRLAGFIVNTIYGVDADRRLETGSSTLPSAEEWVITCPELQNMVASVAPQGCWANDERVPQGVTIASAGDVPHICSIAFPWLTADKEKRLPSDVSKLINIHKRKVDAILQEFVRVLDGRVADDTC